MTDQEVRRSTLRGVVDVVLGFAVLVVADALLNSVPFVAGAAWALGLLLFFLTGSRSIRWTSLGFLAGAVLGAAGHAYLHLNGRSPAPSDGVLVHVLRDAAVGALCGALALTTSVGRHWRRLTKRSTGKP